MVAERITVIPLPHGCTKDNSYTFTSWLHNGTVIPLPLLAQRITVIPVPRGCIKDNSYTFTSCLPKRRHCVVPLSKNINPSLVLVQPGKTRPFISERLLMGRKESSQTNKQTKPPACTKDKCYTFTSWLHKG